MKPFDNTDKGRSLCRLSPGLAAAVVLLFGAPVTRLDAAQPSWWAGRGAVDARATVDDNAAMNEGQLKQFTFKAVGELNADLPGFGAGASLNSLVNSWVSDYAANGYSASNPKPSDYQVMTTGQIKTIANMVWHQLVAAGYAGSVPSWLDVNDRDTEAANIGQLKTVFNFDLLHDSDGNGLPDWWQMHYFGRLGNKPDAVYSNGQTILKCYRTGLDPVTAKTAGVAVPQSGNSERTAVCDMQRVLEARRGAPGLQGVLFRSSGGSVRIAQIALLQEEIRNTGDLKKRLELIQQLRILQGEEGAIRSGVVVPMQVQQMVRDAVAQVAKREGYDRVYDMKSVLYTKGSDDITDEVIRMLSISPPYTQHRSGPLQDSD